MPATAVLSLDAARAEFDGGRGYLAACTTGIPPRASREAVRADLDAAGAGRIDITTYSDAVERSRGLFAALVGAAPDRVAIASQASVAASLIAASLPHGAEVLVPAGDFSSIVLPFVHAGRGLRVRTAPFAGLAEAIRPDTALVSFSAVQSATGEVADLGAVAAAASHHDARTFCDATQAVGWLPIDATMFDAVVCHAYKWLCSPRGVAFLTVSESLAATLTPVHAGWYAGADPWSSCYGGEASLASDARRFDVSPAWQAFVGAAPALALFAATDIAEVHAHTTALASRFRDGFGLTEPVRPSAIVTWDDLAGGDLARLSAAGLAASGRAGRARIAFHLFNDEADVDAALAALR